MYIEIGTLFYESLADFGIITAQLSCICVYSIRVCVSVHTHSTFCVNKKLKLLLAFGFKLRLEFVLEFYPEFLRCFYIYSTVLSCCMYTTNASVEASVATYTQMQLENFFFA